MFVYGIGYFMIQQPPDDMFMYYGILIVGEIALFYTWRNFIMWYGDKHPELQKRDFQDRYK